jgi:CheY-like chemotaxis protein
MAKASDPFRIWLIDDSPDHHAVAAETVARRPLWHLSGFLHGSDAIAAFADLADERPDELPDVVLMDFFLGDERGDAVTAELRRLETAAHRPVIIGYSSVASASQHIIASGADLALRKHRDESGVNPTLLRYLEQYENARPSRD